MAGVLCFQHTQGRSTSRPNSTTQTDDPCAHFLSLLRRWEPKGCKGMVSVASDTAFNGCDGEAYGYHQLQRYH
jgi:hypothetical protein